MREEGKKEKTFESHGGVTWFCIQTGSQTKLAGECESACFNRGLKSSRQSFD
jgi:hypothetical protein